MDNIKDLTLFHNDNFLVFVFKKSQAIINGLYLVTNLFPENEPLKISLRSKAITILEDTLSLTAKNAGERKVILNRLVAKLLEIMVLSETSANAKLISPMNANIIKDELGNLIKVIEERQKDAGIVLNQKLFGPSFNDGDRSLTAANSVRPTASSGEVKINPRITISNGERERTILNFLKDKGEGISIKEIATALPNLGDKTLQRELQRMVSAGLLKKEGERRWSRYSATTL